MSWPTGAKRCLGSPVWNYSPCGRPGIDEGRCSYHASEVRQRTQQRLLREARTVEDDLRSLADRYGPGPGGDPNLLVTDNVHGPRVRDLVRKWARLQRAFWGYE